MEPQGSPSDLAKPTQVTEAMSCRKKKSEGASVLEDFRSHIDEFLHASMDEHQSCLKNTLQKMFGISKSSRSKSASVAQESILALQVTTSKKGFD
eukprot:c44098_g1_i1 orf=387-671(-)